jgi:hypothetical protein
MDYYNTIRGKYYRDTFSFKETYTVTVNLPKNSIIKIPNNGTYINNGLFLKVYRNNVLQELNTHYTEKNKKSVKFLIKLEKNDVLRFEN